MLILISRFLFMAAVWRVAEGKTPPPYRSSGPCNTAFEYYAKNLGLCCSRCKPGTHLAVMCTSISDTICEPCQDGQYSENVNHFSNCFSCPKCKGVKGLMYGTNCSADTKAVCVCKPGMLCSKRNFNKECEECRKYRSCKPGEYVIKEGKRQNNLATVHKHLEAPLQSSPKPTRPKEPSNLRGQTQEMKRMNTTTTSSLAPSSRAISSTPVGQDDMIYFLVVVVGIVLVLLILAVMVITCKLRKRKAGLQKVPVTDGNKLEQDASASSTPDYQRLLPVVHHNVQLS
ncbi:tumor necrosis factor receptor superfamily member 3-like [Sinocyclocheilus rhinocerous]|uniref:tumor necrosis factor receptor superfamily member 3-like n=1 Tax=Sinocyclocheilus rhinocerous TaxID=307959 RepID=UPI0007B9D1E8|nr:PREDICTED: tumor necrosis factor receptor superfamily member 3-like [Sinocyclocheilus rhinocerous]